MEFESPDVEKEFPGLYSSEPAKKANRHEFSDEISEKSLIVKKKEKKDKKDRGYAALEGESSQDEGDSKSPSKSKKTKSFQFPVKKSEKREKSREKEVKEKDGEKDKKKDKEKKEKLKVKEKKKHKNVDDTESDEHAVFGVALESAVARLGCLDGVAIPLPVRHCIDCIHTAGLSCDNLYRATAVKTKVQAMKKSYNCREPVSSSDMDVSIASSLLQLYLRELPENILTGQLVARFEEAAATQHVAQREEALAGLLKQLPVCNRTLVGWLVVHFDHVTQHEDLNKMNAQSIAMIFSPILQMSHRLLTAFLCHCKSLFTDISVYKYIPPLPPGSTFPDEPISLAVELQKQEALLNQLHRDMSEGFVSKVREEQLWEVQRIVTQLKRKLKGLMKTSEMSQMQRSMDEEALTTQIRDKLCISNDPKKEQKDVSVAEICIETPGPEVRDVATYLNNSEETLLVEGDSLLSDPVTPTEEILSGSQPVGVGLVSLHHTGHTSPCARVGVATQHKLETQPSSSKTESTKLVAENSNEIAMVELRLQLENAELHDLHAKLEDRLGNERRLAAKFRAQIETYRGFIASDDSEESSSASTPAYLSPETEARLEQLISENQMLTTKRDELARKIMEEREACMKLSASINYIQLVNKVAN